MFRSLKFPSKILTSVCLQINNNPLRLNALCVSRFSAKANIPKEKYTQKTPRPRTMDPNLKTRPNPVVVKLDSPQFQSIFTRSLKDLIALFKKNNYEIRVAGGAVRDLLMNKVPKDIDFATTATPQQMIDMFTKEEIRMVNANGVAHGTVTCRLNDADEDAETFEVTTLRIDVVTDGRRAEVEFTKDWMLDANRRDLTINSMFLDFDGSVYDWFYGYEDLQNRHVAFVGTASRRIQEDYLRILRYFRFYGRIADQPDKHDQATLETITENIGGLERVSGERIWGELAKILRANFAIELLSAMLKCQAGKYIGLPADLQLDELSRIKKCQETTFVGISFHPITIVSSLLNSTDDTLKLHLRLKLSAYERDLAIYLTQNKADAKDVNDILSYQRMCLQTTGRPGLMKEFVLELLKYNDKRELHDQLLAWEIPRFPVSGKILLDSGCPPGKKVSIVMSKMRDIWSEHAFTISVDELLKHLPQIISDLESGKTGGGVQNKTIKKNK